jgi:hypothetical protein
MDGSYFDLNMRMYDISYTERKKHSATTLRIENTRCYL